MGIRIDVEVDGRSLAAPLLLDDRELYASTRSTFYYEGVAVDLEFHEDDSGVMHMTLNLQGNLIEFIRL